MSKPRSKKPAKKANRQPPKQLSEETSAHVIAEYLSIGAVAVTEEEVNSIINEVGRNLSPHEIAIVFRISEILGVQNCFAIAPRYEIAMKRASAIVHLLTRPESAEAQQDVQALEVKS